MRFPSLFFGLAVVAALLPAKPSTAQSPPAAPLLETAGALEPGDPTLSDGSLYDPYPIEGRAGQTLAITLESLEFDTFLLVLDSQGNEIARNNDIDPGAGNYQSFAAVTLPADGSYRIFVNGADRFSTGQYALTVLETSPELATPALSTRAQSQVEANRLLAQGNQQFQTSRFRESLYSYESALEIYRAIGDRKGQANGLMNLGVANFSMNDYRGAIAYYEQALPLFEATEDRQGQARVLTNLGNANLSLNDYRGAIAYYEQALPLFEAIEDRQGQASVLMNLGLANWSLNNYRGAIAYYEQALPLFEAIEDRQGQARVLTNLGNANSSLNDYRGAIAYYEQALPLFEAIEDRHGQASVLMNLGVTNLSLNNYRGAIAYYEQALPLFEAIEDRQGQARVLMNLGVASRSLNDYRRAITYYEQALPLFEAIEDRQGQAGTLMNLGVASRSLSDYRRAITYYEQALPLFEAIEDRQGQANVLISLGNANSSLSDYRRAITYYEQALPLFEAIEDRQGQANTLTNLGNANSALSDHRGAIAYYEQALPLFEVIEDRQGQANVLISLGNANSSLSDYRGAITYYEQALPLFEAIEDRHGQANGLMNLGLTNSSLNNYQGAIAYYEQALPLFEAIEDRQGQARVLNNLGNANQSLSDYPGAIAYYEQALPLFKAIEDRHGQANGLMNLGLANSSLNNYQGAIAYYEQALPLFEAIEDRQGQARVLNNLGNANQSLSDYPGAIAYYEQALPLFEAIEDRQGQALVLMNLGVANQSLSDYRGAIAYYEQALPLFEAIEDREGQGKLLSNLGTLFALQDQNELAIVFYKASVNVRESIRGGLIELPQTLQQSYTDSVADTYRALADLLLAKGDILEAQRVLELLKIEELREYTRGRVADVGTRQVVLTATESTVIERHGSLVAFGLGLAQCRAASSCANEDKARLAALTEEFNAAVAQMESEAKAEAAARQAQQQNRIDQARAGLHPDKFIGTAGELVADQRTVLVYPVVLDDKLWVFWGSAGGIANPVEVPVGRAEIGATVLRFRQLMEACETGRCTASDIPAAQSVAQALYRYLIPPQLESELAALQATLPPGQVPNLVIAPDLVARYIPFAALFDGSQYLIEKYAVSTILSAEQTEADNPLINPSETEVLALGLSNAVPQHGFPRPLDNVPAELDTIVRETDAEPGIFRGFLQLNEKFNAQSLWDAENYQILHIATHGVFDPDGDDRSFLMLGIGEPLYIRDLETAKTYFQDLSLVVLSACETALSDVDQTGLELASIANTFLSARVDAVVASLWQVNDSATNDLMQQFYANLASSSPAQRISVSQALRQAQLDLLTGSADPSATNRSPAGNNASIEIGTSDPSAAGSGLPRTAHPYYWAPFIIIGNGL